MRVLVVLSSIVVLCTGKLIPFIHGDNNSYVGYVEGTSHHILMLDGFGAPHPVGLWDNGNDEDIHTARNGTNNEYWLYTRSNPTTPQIITYNDKESLLASNYDGSRPLTVIVHGWNNRGSSTVNTMITAAFLKVSNCNVIVVDWSHSSNSLYEIAVKAVPSVGQHLGSFLNWLISAGGGNFNNVHLAGHSLGAHVVGNAGREVGGRIARVTGLDPAGPLWLNNSGALKASDGQYVEAIHTDGGSLGMMGEIGHADFYPNGGTHPQPGCIGRTCSHARAYKLFAASVEFDNFIGHQCNSITEVQENKCNGTSTLNMGNSVPNKSGAGIFYLTTGSEWPYFK